MEGGRMYLGHVENAPPAGSLRDLVGEKPFLDHEKAWGA
jgi:hypothetical protein